LAEGLSKLIDNAKIKGLLRGLKMAPNVFLSHLLFVDDIIIFGVGNVKEFKVIKSILDLYCTTTGMQINKDKSIMLSCTLEEVSLEQLKDCFPFSWKSLDEGKKYLGFDLKLVGYKVEDWLWIPRKIQARVSNWTFCLLSRGGHFGSNKLCFEQNSHLLGIHFQDTKKYPLENKEKFAFNSSG
jgi:hypothetical protein